MPKPDPAETKSIWDSADPCAFLCYAIKHYNFPFDYSVKSTLDSFGWLNKDGQPDIEKALREFQRVSQLANEKSF